MKNQQTLVSQQQKGSSREGPNGPDFERQERRRVIRPEHLPDYTNPPLNEVVLGVQFAPARNYQQIQAYEVWQLFKETFPNVEEYPAIPPAFETFGLPAGPQLNFGFVTGAQHDRFWFLSPKKEELIQFQSDRLLHNWRKVGDQTNEYPRFERMIVNFESELKKLEQYFASLASQRLNINQCEISYINHIQIGNGRDGLGVSDVLRFAQFQGEQPEDVSFSFRNTIYDEKSGPVGRIIGEAQIGVNNLDQSRIIALTITARGAPTEPNISGALNFLKLGREMVVNTFTDVTTDLCHERWGRTK